MERKSKRNTEFDGTGHILQMLPPFRECTDFIGGEIGKRALFKFVEIVLSPGNASHLNPWRLSFPRLAPTQTTREKPGELIPCKASSPEAVSIFVFDEPEAFSSF